MNIRLDPITQQPVLIATQRAKRPHFGKSKPTHPAIDADRILHTDKQLNPFAPGNEHITGPEVWADSDNPHRAPNQSDWKVRVINNKYPITEYHEVVIISPHPKNDFSQISYKQAKRVIAAFAQRTKEMEQHGSPFLFCNHGPAAGASIAHPHAQLMSFPTLAPNVKKEVESLKHIYETKESCGHCDLLKKEMRVASRVVWQNDNFVLLCPESSGWPYALSIFPKIHQASFAAIDNEIAGDLAEALQLLISLYRKVLFDPPYNYWVHSAKGHFYHWHLDSVPRTKTLAGVELGAGIMINDRVTPEDAAKEFRLAIKSLKR